MRGCSVESCERVHYGKGFCSLHYRRWKRNGDPRITRRIFGRDNEATLLKLEQRMEVDPSTSCWIWSGAKIPDGYGQVRHQGKPAAVHRVAYSLLVGPIPEGLTLDHLCRRRDCFNPDHLEPVTAIENTRRGDHKTSHRNRVKTHCKRGHPLAGDNLVCTSQGKRQCRMCNRLRMEAMKRGLSVDELCAALQMPMFRTNKAEWLVDADA